jgi:heme-degrading monooxygenase HmoA
MRHFLLASLGPVIIIPAPDQQDLFAVNVFEVRPENQQSLIDCIRSAGDPAGIPGLLSMHLLRSEDGTQVTNFMHWASKDALDSATATNPVIAATRTGIRRFIEGSGPRPFEVIEVRARRG